MYVTLLLNQVTSFPVSGIGIGYRYRQTQYYSVSGIGCLSGIVLTLYTSHMTSIQLAQVIHETRRMYNVRKVDTN